MNQETIWKLVLDNLKLSLSTANFSTWFSQTFITQIKPIDENRQICEIGCSSSFIANTIENRYYALIKDNLDSLTDKKNDLVFIIKQFPDKEKPSQDDSPLFNQPKQEKDSQEKEVQVAITRARLRPNFTFDNFAVSSTNQMAHAAAQAVADSIGKAYNPLFLYGGVGVGKTHLMQAIAHQVLKKKPKTKIIYCTSEEFTNDIINAIRRKNTEDFKKQYRSVKLLMVDDIQFIAGKETAQEEFFHTFNSLWSLGGQIVLTSDRSPEEIKKLEDRLRSRFEGGLIIDIQNPNFELRTAILQIKAQQAGIDLPMDVAQIIASNVTSTRKLEGFLVRLISEAKTRRVPINPQLAQNLIGTDLELDPKKKNIQPKIIKRAILNHYSVKATDLDSSKRNKTIVFPRQVLMYLLRNDLKLPYVNIGQFLGGRDHTTIMHGVEKITRLLPENEDIRVDIDRIRKEVYG